ncbi:efflux transporter outer membrane subunit [Haloferula sp.]|uniref:efflux transporter outer membrane subunit n=1 Tax=Haloferula sp. TaxID=2497595 RepID=UPI00329F5AD3
MRTFRRFFALPLSVLIPSCMVVGVDYTSPDTITPDYWNQNLSSDLNSGNSSLESWWTKFNDSTLNLLIDKARESNRDLAIAYERVSEARASRGVSRSALFPSVDFNGGVTRNRTSENLGIPGGKTSDFWTTGLDAGWEIDFFGGVRRSIESADATVEGAEELYRDTMVSLFAEVAFNYIQVRTIERRIQVAENNIKLQKNSVDLTRDRLDAGLVPETDTSQAETNLATTKAIIPLLRNERSIAVNRLATLIGRFPQPTESLLGKSKGIPTPKGSAGVGIPADLVRARPDIRAAERQLAAQTALIGVAEADLLPRFALTGNFELQSLHANNLLESSSRNYGFGPSFRWNIFSAGRIKNEIAIEESRTKQAFYSYQNAVLKGVEEVENSLSTVRNERDRLSQLNTAVESSRKTESLVYSSYEEGLTDFQTVLDAQRTVFDNEDQRVISEGQIAAGYVSLYKSLGGGTKMKPPTVEKTGKP